MKFPPILSTTSPPPPPPPPLVHPPLDTSVGRASTIAGGGAAILNLPPCQRPHRGGGGGTQQLKAGSKEIYWWLKLTSCKVDASVINLQSLGRYDSQVSFWSKKFGPRKLLPQPRFGLTKECSGYGAPLNSYWSIQLCHCTKKATNKQTKQISAISVVFHQSFMTSPVFLVTVTPSKLCKLVQLWTTCPVVWTKCSFYPECLVLGFHLIEPQLFGHESPLRPQPWPLWEEGREKVRRDCDEELFPHSVLVEQSQQN